MAEINKSLVSVIIRTIGRKEITRAIKSITKQTYKNIELIIVNDGDGDGDFVKGVQGGSVISLKLINNQGRHGRCVAANLGLDSATGEYIMFLDDDDWVDVEHVEKLVKAITESKEAVLAYTGAVLIDESNNEIGRFDFLLDKRQILAGNFMPIHSVLFCADVRDKGCRFDEGLDIYEDWDFWIQLSRLGEFVYTPGISAYYILADGKNSNAHIKQYAEAATRKLLKKWQLLWDEDDLLFLTQESVRAREIDGIKKRCEEFEKRCKEFDRQVKRNEALELTINELLSSNSWKITKPLRDIADVFRKIANFDREFGAAIAKYRRFFEKGSSYNGNILHKTKFESQNGDKLCIFSHFDREGVIDEYVLNYLLALKSIGCDIVFVSTAKDIQKEELSKLESICSQSIIKENIGYDFGAWSTGINECGRIIENYNTLVLCNDSVYAPLFDLRIMFEKMSERKLDAWSVTDSMDISYHMQSYFLVFGKKILRNDDFMGIWQRYVVYKNKRNIIEKYEVGLSKFLLNRGFAIGAYCETKKVSNYKTNITHTHWRELILEYQCPTIKIELLRDNPLGVDISDVEQVISQHTQYNFALISKHLARVLKERR